MVELWYLGTDEHSRDTGDLMLTTAETLAEASRIIVAPNHPKYG